MISRTRPSIARFSACNIEKLGVAWLARLHVSVSVLEIYNELIIMMGAYMSVHYAAKAHGEPGPFYEEINPGIASMNMTVNDCYM